MYEEGWTTSILLQVDRENAILLYYYWYAMLIQIHARVQRLLIIFKCCEYKVVTLY